MFKATLDNHYPVLQIGRLLLEYCMANNERLLSESRPWGGYQVLYDGEDCKVKRIIVNPGQRLSLQSHERRQEDWHVIAGQGEVELGHSKHDVHVDSHVFIAREQKHRVKNTGTVDLVFIEIQTGTYFGEDDITRYEDDYGRG